MGIIINGGVAKPKKILINGSVVPKKVYLNGTVIWTDEVFAAGWPVRDWNNGSAQGYGKWEGSGSGENTTITITVQGGGSGTGAIRLMFQFDRTGYSKLFFKSLHLFGDGRNNVYWSLARVGFSDAEGNIFANLIDLKANYDNWYGVDSKFDIPGNVGATAYLTFDLYCANTVSGAEANMAMVNGIWLCN